VRAEADLAARRAGIQHKRMKIDPVFRDRLRLYLRGEINWPEVFADIGTHEEWWRRMHEAET
jgi:hypothetical protein